MKLAYPLAVVGVLVVAPDGDLLLVKSHKWPGVFSIPGGKVDLGETTLAAAKREVKEETGLDVDHLSFVCYQDCVYSPEFYRETHFIALDFIAHLTQETSKNDVKLNEEHQDYIWISPELAIQLPLNSITKNLIDAYLKRLCTQH